MDPLSIFVLVLLALIALKFGATILRWSIKLAMAFVFVVGLIHILQILF